MDKEQAPGIAIENVILTACRLGNYDSNAKLTYNLGLTGKERKLSEDKKSLHYLFSFDLMKGVAKPPFACTCQFCVHYSRAETANMTWEEFTDAHALTHVLPYLREFVMNMTTRMVVPPLAIPPTNVYALLKEYDETGQIKSVTRTTKTTSPAKTTGEATS